MFELVVSYWFLIGAICGFLFGVWKDWDLPEDKINNHLGCDILMMFAFIFAWPVCILMLGIWLIQYEFEKRKR